MRDLLKKRQPAVNERPTTKDNNPCRFLLRTRLNQHAGDQRCVSGATTMSIVDLHNTLLRRRDDASVKEKKSIIFEIGYSVHGLAVVQASKRKKALMDLYRVRTTA